MAAPATESAYTVGDAIAALKRHQPQSAARIAQIYAQHAHTRLGTEQALKDYLCVAKDEPLDWLRTFPTEWKSASVFDKAMAAVNQLLKLDDVVQAMDREDPTLLDGVRTEIKSKLTGKAVAAEAHRRRMMAGGGAQPEPASPGTPDLESKLVSAESQSQALREACLHVAQGSMIGVTLAGLWASGAFPMEEPQVLIRAYEVLFADNNSIEAFKIIMGGRDPSLPPTTGSISP